MSYSSYSVPTYGATSPPETMPETPVNPNANHTAGERACFARYDAARRYTTITLRELNFYGHCDCCPDPKRPKDKAAPPREEINPSAYFYHARPALVPRTDSEDSTTDSGPSSNSSEDSRHRSNVGTSSGSHGTSSTRPHVSTTVSSVAVPTSAGVATSSVRPTLNEAASSSNSFSWLRRKTTAGQ